MKQVPINSKSFKSEEEWCDSMAKAIDGESWYTGGGIYVCYKQLGHAWLGISTELICLYKSKEEEQEGVEPLFMIDDKSAIMSLDNKWLEVYCPDTKCQVTIHIEQPRISVINNYVRPKNDNEKD